MKSNNISYTEYYTFDFRTFYPMSFKGEIKKLVKVLINRSNLKIPSIHRYYTCVRNHFLPFLKKEGLEINNFKDLSEAIVTKYYLYLFNHKMKKNSKVLNYTALKTLINYGNLYIKNNYPANQIFTRNINRMFQAEDELKTKHINKRVLDVISKNIDFEENIFFKSAVIIAMDSGLRLSEILTLKKGCIIEDFADHPVLYTYSEKNNKEIYVPVSLRVKNIIGQLHTLYTDNDYEFLFMDTKMYIQRRARKDLNNFLFRLNKKYSDLDLSHITFHSFRHTLGVKMINNGATIHQVKAQLNHKSYHSTNLYAKLSDRTIEKEYYSLGVLGLSTVFNGNVKADKTDEEVSQMGYLPDGRCKNIMKDIKICNSYNNCLLCSKFITFQDDLDTHRRHLDRLRNDKVLYIEEEGLSSIERVNRIENALIEIIERLSNEL